MFGNKNEEAQVRDVQFRDVVNMMFACNKMRFIFHLSNTRLNYIGQLCEQ